MDPGQGVLKSLGVDDEVLTEHVGAHIGHIDLPGRLDHLLKANADLMEDLGKLITLRKKVAFVFLLKFLVSP